MSLMDKNTQQIAIKKACGLVGGQASMARYLGVSPPTVNQWISGTRPVPTGQCPEIEKATSGAVTCEELRPDVDWAYLRGTTSGLEGMALMPERRVGERRDGDQRTDERRVDDRRGKKSGGAA